MPSHDPAATATSGSAAPRRSSSTYSWSRLVHAAIALVVLAALVTQLVLIATGGADANSGRNHDGAGVGLRLVRLFSFFTIQSNLLVLVVAVSLALDPTRDGRLWRVLRLDALLGIVITGAVFGAVLAAQVDLSGAALWATIGFHYISPWATLLAWLVFGPRPRIDLRTSLLTLAWPLGWIAYTFVHGALAGWYPYPFLDAEIRGYGVALRNTGAVVVLAAVLMAGFAALDARLPRRPTSG